MNRRVQAACRVGPSLLFDNTFWQRLGMRTGRYPDGHGPNRSRPRDAVECAGVLHLECHRVSARIRQGRADGYVGDGSLGHIALEARARQAAVTAVVKNEVALVAACDRVGRTEDDFGRGDGVAVDVDVYLQRLVDSGQRYRFGGWSFGQAAGVEDAVVSVVGACLSVVAVGDRGQRPVGARWSFRAAHRVADPADLPAACHPLHDQIGAEAWEQLARMRGRSGAVGDLDRVRPEQTERDLTAGG